MGAGKEVSCLSVRLCGSDVGQLGFATELALTTVGVWDGLSVCIADRTSMYKLTHDHNGGLHLDCLVAGPRSKLAARFWYRLVRKSSEAVQSRL